MMAISTEIAMSLEQFQARMDQAIAAERERLVQEGAFVHDGRIMLVRSEGVATKMPTIHELIKEAVTAERERCAWIAECFDDEQIAAAIREGTAVRKGK